MAGIEDVEGILSTPQVRLDAALLKAAKRLRVVSVFGVGMDHIDVEAARDAGITVINTAGANAAAVAELAMGFILALGRELWTSVELVREGGWNRLDVAPVVSGLENSVLGLIGFGRIGQEVAIRAASFGMKVLYYDVHEGPALTGGAEKASLDELLRKSDFVSLHVDLNPSTFHLIDAERLALMQPTAFLINTSRGPVVAEDALRAALTSGQLAGAALDVLEVEPPGQDNQLTGLPNVLITPHVGASTRAARRRMADMAIESLIAELSKPTSLSPTAADMRTQQHD